MNKLFFSLIKEKMGIILMSGVLLGALSFLFLVINETNFKVKTDYLIVQNQTGNQDFYTLVRSSEYIASIFSEAIYSELFINEMIKTEKVKSEFLPFNKKDRLKEWGKIVKVNHGQAAGIIKINVFHDNQSEAFAISESIAEVLKSKSYLFRGHGQDIDIRILSGPILEKNPSFQNIFLVVLGGFLAGIMLMLAWTYYRQNEIFFESPKEKMSSDQISGNIYENTDIIKPDEYEESLLYMEK